VILEMERRVMQLAEHLAAFCDITGTPLFSVGLPATDRRIDLLWCMARDPGGRQSIRLEH
jgi:hypothetical protein